MGAVCQIRKVARDDWWTGGVEQMVRKSRIIDSAFRLDSSSSLSGMKRNQTQDCETWTLSYESQAFFHVTFFSIFSHYSAGPLDDFDGAV